MHQIFNGYDAIIFDCDGVILDSNNLKVDAMRKSLLMAHILQPEIDSCCDYFKKNFGKSRFHHVQHFIKNIITIKNESLYENILRYYSLQCKDLYLTAEVTPGFFDAIAYCPAKLFVASGSEQEELRGVFSNRGLDRHFTLILGSPTAKVKNVATILELTKGKVLMVGDALSDFHAAKENDIDFIGYLPFSSVKNEMENLSIREKFPILWSW